MAQKLTPWFPATVKPFRPGMYIASVGKNRFYRRWTGSYWTIGAYGLNDAFECPPKKFGYQDMNWRGLSSEPT